MVTSAPTVPDAIQRLARPPRGSRRPSVWEGVLAHVLIQRDYVHQHTRRGHTVVTERRLYSPDGSSRTVGQIPYDGTAYSRQIAIVQLTAMTKRPGRRRGYLRPDILNLTSNELYEIKPRSVASIGEGLAYLDAYLIAYNGNAVRCGPPVPFIRPGGWQPRPFYILSPTVFIHVFTVPELPGLILYDLYDIGGDEGREARDRPVQRVAVQAQIRGQVLLLQAAVTVAVIVVVIVLVIEPVPGDEAVAAAVGGQIVRELGRQATRALRRAPRHRPPIHPHVPPEGPRPGL